MTNRFSYAGLAQTVNWSVMTSSPAGSTHGTFLDGLATAFNTVDRSSNIQTMQFAKACEAILPVFDKLGKCRICGTPSLPLLQRSAAPLCILQ